MDIKQLKALAKEKMSSAKPDIYIWSIVFLFLTMVSQFAIGKISKIEFKDYRGDAIILGITLFLSIVFVVYDLWLLNISRYKKSWNRVWLFLKEHILPLLCMLVVINAINYGILLLVRYAGEVLYLIVSPIPFIALAVEFIFVLCFIFVLYCYRDNSKAGIIVAFKRSLELTNGMKKYIVLLLLSFIPWLALTVLTAGLVGIYVVPYIKLAIIEFYEEVKNGDYIEDDYYEDDEEDESEDATDDEESEEDYDDEDDDDFPDLDDNTEIEDK